MADQSCTPEQQPSSDDGLVSFEAAAALEFDPIPINQSVVGLNWEQWNNPYAITLRLAATICAKTKPELIDVATSMGGATEGGGELPELVQRLDGTRKLLTAMLDLIDMADARLFSACCVASAVEVRA